MSEHPCGMLVISLKTSDALEGVSVHIAQTRILERRRTYRCGMLRRGKMLDPLVTNSTLTSLRGEILDQCHSIKVQTCSPDGCLTHNNGEESYHFARESTCFKSEHAGQGCICSVVTVADDIRLTFALEDTSHHTSASSLALLPHEFVEGRCFTGAFTCLID